MRVFFFGVAACDREAGLLASDIFLNLSSHESGVVVFCVHDVCASQTRTFIFKELGQINWNGEIADNLAAQKAQLPLLLSLIEMAKCLHARTQLCMCAHIHECLSLCMRATYTHSHMRLYVCTFGEFVCVYAYLK